MSFTIFDCINRMTMTINDVLKLFFCCLVFLCCNTNDQNSSQTQTNNSKVTQQAKSQSGPLIPSIPKETMEKLYRDCDYTDYIFHDLPFSMSQDEKASIRANLNYISITPLGTIPTGCKAMGRQFFHINGDIVLEANVYFDDKCMFYVFVDGETPLFANMMSDQGIEFFSRMINQALDAQKKSNQ